MKKPEEIQFLRLLNEHCSRAGQPGKSPRKIIEENDLCYKKCIRYLSRVRNYMYGVCEDLGWLEDGWDEEYRKIMLPLPPEEK